MYQYEGYSWFGVENIRGDRNTPLKEIQFDRACLEGVTTSVSDQLHRLVGNIQAQPIAPIPSYEAPDSSSVQEGLDNLTIHTALELTPARVPSFSPLLLGFTHRTKITYGHR